MKVRFVYVGIRVKDLDKSIEFYTKLLGMKLKRRVKVEQTKGECVNLESEEGSFTLELNYYPEDSPFYTEYVPGEGLDHLAFSVDDLDKALEEAGRAGHPAILEQKAGDSRWVYIEDPNGLWVELF